MSSATELAYGTPWYEPVPALIIRKLTDALEKIANISAKAESGKNLAWDISVVRAIAEEVLEEYIQPMKDHGTPPFHRS